MTTPPTPPTPNHVSPAPSAAPREPFACQAAKFALYAPLVAILINLLSYTALNPAPNSVPTTASLGAARLFISVLNLALNVSALLLAIYALLSIPKLGTKNILGRALTGLFLSGVFVAAALYLSFFFHPHAPATKPFEGHWTATVAAHDGTNVHPQLELNPDGSAHYFIPDLPTKPDFRGRWRIIAKDPPPGRILTITIDHALPGTPDHLNWEIQRVDDDTRLQLVPPNSSDRIKPDIYIRQPR